MTGIFDKNYLEKNKFKTSYDWCIQHKIRPIDLKEWPAKWHNSQERAFFEFPVPESDFLKCIEGCKTEPNLLPRKTENYLEYRMYGFVPYNMSPIQQGIQFGHAVVDYGRARQNHKSYNKWADKDKTFIILNGGTTNDREDYYGTLQRHRDALNQNKIFNVEFREPDINDSLTAVVFLVDERVFNKELYPDFVHPWLQNDPNNLVFINEEHQKEYTKWEEEIGGPSNAFLKNFLKNFKLA